MNTSLYKKGSEWRKWDLHIHTPASFHWSGGKRFFEMNITEKEHTFSKMLETINNSDVAAFAITDYWTFDGYVEFKEYIKKKNLKLNKTVFPGMELRVEAPVDYRLNIQVILSDELTTQQLKDFKAKLKIGSINRSLSNDAIKEFALSLDDSKAKVQGFESPSSLNDAKLLELGSKTVVVTKESLCGDAFTAIPPKSGYILLPYDTSDGLIKLDWATHPHDDNYFMQSAHIFESRNDESIDLFLNRETPKNKSFIKNIIKTLGGKPKPVISGSDAHKIQDYGKYPSGKITWIKADVTFQGLKQVINEPADRAFIGNTPFKLIEVVNNKSKHIDSIKIVHTAPGTTPAWFSDELQLNNGLVAIIGKKGSGKSALADIISLCGDSKINQKDYSFLTTQKFKKRGLAKNYEAKLVWLDKQEISKSLDGEVDTNTSVERIKYLPQQYVETICNEEGVSTLFQQEIDKVIFSYVPEEGRLGTHNLAELIRTRTESVDSSILTLRNELHRVNEKITLHEDKESPKYSENLREKLTEKERELKNLPQPKIVKKPKTTLNKGTESKIRKLTTSINKIDEQIITARQELKEVNGRLHKFEKITDRIASLKGGVIEFIESFQEDATEMGIDLTKVVSIKVNDGLLKTKGVELSTQKDKLELQLEQNNPGSITSLYVKKAKLEATLTAITSTLDADQKQYKEYLQALKDYEGKKQLIEGKKGDTSLDSIISLQEEIDFVKNKLKGVLQLGYKKRNETLKMVFGQLGQKIKFYKEIYAPIVSFIESEKETQEKSGNILSFSAGLTFGRQKFIDDFFSYVNQGKDGSFQTIAGGQIILNAIIEKYDLTTEDGICNFAEDILNHLRSDKTGTTPKTSHIKNQLKKDQTSFYDFIFNLGYLDVKYKILFNGKDLNANEFSPGEKGALLLIFYLLIDKENIPLVIDQPEENLDNESVYTLLVPYIKKAKSRRQIIAVTHNPNLAVVCDAEQIICASMDKKKSEIRYVSGSIENYEMNKKIVDILEGTLPAFTVRDRSYIRKS